jgi:peroxiredoxin (alkyl hydroperoxide reductase subunit C)
MTAEATTPRGIPRIGDPAPDFTAPTTQGEIHFSQWQKDAWVLLFSHPADFTPVCTTELSEFARRSAEFKRRNVKLIGLSEDSIHSHLAWRENIREKLGVELDYPLIADVSGNVAELYGLIHPGESQTATVRAVFAIDPKHAVRAIIYYPLNVGRNIDEIVRLIDALQATDKHAVATPVNWTPGARVVVPPPKTEAEVTARRNGAYAEKIDFYLNKTDLPAQAQAAAK